MGGAPDVKKRVVSRGRIKVDARRAVAKLREHLLLDPDTWPLEVARVASMCGATGVSVEHDADDLRIAFDGAPPAAERVARLLDFALESSRDPAVRALRLLAVALNAAISTHPRGITVTIPDDGAGAARFAFDPGLHAREGASEADAEAGRMLRREAVAGDALRGASVVVEMSKGFSWGTFVRFASQRPLREVTLLHEATRRSTVPLTFLPEVAVEARPEPVMVVSLDEHGLPGGVLEVRSDVSTGPRIVFLEHGVELADVALPASLAIPVEGFGVHLPVDVYVEADHWPTNASRSQVHGREVSRIVEAVHAVLPTIGLALGALAEGDAALDGVVRRPSRADARRAAQAFACCAAQGDREGPLGGMLDLPLARDAVGRPLTIGRVAALGRRAMESAGAERVFVHRGSAPLPEAFAPFSADVPWLEGSLADRVLAGAHTRDFADVHRDVKAGIARRDAWLRQPAGLPRVPRRATELFRTAIDESSTELEGLRGEVVLHVGRREPAHAWIHVEGRVLVNLLLDGTLPIEAAIEWPGRLRPALSFEAVVDDANLRLAIAEVARVGAAMLAAHAGVLAAPSAAPEVRALGRAALAADPASRRGPMAEAPLWPTVDGGWTSLADIDGRLVAETEVPRAAAKRNDGRRRRGSRKAMTEVEAPAASSVAIAFVQRPPKDGRAKVPGGRRVLVLDAVDARRLQAAMERDVVMVPYGPALGRVDDETQRPVGDALDRLLGDALAAQGIDEALVVSFDDGPVRVLCATSLVGRQVQTFAGIALRDAEAPDAVPAVIIVEDARAVPTPQWDGLLVAPPPPAVDALVALAHAVRLTLLADATKPPRYTVDLAHRGIRAARPEHLRAWAVATLAATSEAKRTKSELHRTLLEIPFLRILDEQARPVATTPTAARRVHTGATMPYLTEPPDFPTGGWRPLLVRSRSARFELERALGCSLEDVSGDLARRRELYELELSRRKILSLPKQPLAGPIPGGLATSPVAIGGSDGGDGLRALVGLREGPSASFASCALRYDGRHVAELSLSGVPPQVAVVLDTTNTKHVERWAGISAAGRTAGIDATNEAARELAANLISAAAGVAFESSWLGTAIGCELVCGLLRRSQSLQAALQVATVMVESAFGDRIPLSAAWCEGPTPIARRPFPPHLAARIAQAPVLLEPRHAGLEQLLQSAGLVLQDVTRALAQATGTHDTEAKLPGPPSHAALRSPLASLGLKDVVGELEICAPGQASIEVLVLGDSVHTAAPELPFGVRAIVVPKQLDTRPKAIREVATRIGEAALRHLEALAPSIEALPPLVGEAIRACLRRDLEAGRQPPRALAEAAAFVDVTGRSWSMRALLGKRIRFTTEGPPYPETAAAKGEEPAVLRLEPSFAAGLRKAGVRSVFDATRELRLDLEAEARAALPPVPAELGPELVRGCFAVAELAEEAVRGQLGLLLPSRRGDAKIAVHVGGRPVCALDAPRGWPVVAIVDDPNLGTNRRRDALVPASQAEAVVQRVMRRRAALLAEHAAPPRHAFASVALSRSYEAFDVSGQVWLDTDDPNVPGAVTVYFGGLADARPTSLGSAGLEGVSLGAEARDAVPGFPKRLPVSGTLFVSPADPRARLDGSLRSLLGSIVADSLVALLREPGPSGSERLQRWRWAAALWGAHVETAPLLDTAGKRRNTAEVLRELRRRRVLWSSRHAGLADGEFPDDAPSFIVLDDGRVELLALLEEHAPALVRELGAIDVAREKQRPGLRSKKRPAKTPETASGTDRAAPEGGLFDVRAANRARGADAIAGGVGPAETGGGDAVEPTRSWLSRVAAVVSELTSAAPLPVLGLEHPLVSAIATAAEKLGRPVPTVVDVDSGRPLTYVAKGDVLRVHTAHPSVAALLGRGEVELLAATAIGEINRVLEAVTDAEEARTTVALLERRAARKSS